MSAYYDAINRAVAAQNESTAITRHALYDRARSALAAQIRTAAPPLEKEDSDRAILALEDAIRRVEQEVAGRHTSISPQAIATAKSRNAANLHQPASLNIGETRTSTYGGRQNNSLARTTDIFRRRPSLLISFLVSRLRLNKTFGRKRLDARWTATEHKLRWATKFFIYSAAIILFLEARSVFNSWWDGHTPQKSWLDAAAQFIGYMVRNLSSGSIPYLLALINGLVLRRYKSRIAAALFALFGLIGLGLGVIVLIQTGIVYLSVASIMFFGVYLAIAAWTYDVLSHPKHIETDEEAGES